LKVSGLTSVVINHALNRHLITLVSKLLKCCHIWELHRQKKIQWL